MNLVQRRTAIIPESGKTREIAERHGVARVTRKLGEPWSFSPPAPPSLEHQRPCFGFSRGSVRKSPLLGGVQTLLTMYVSNLSVPRWLEPDWHARFAD